MNFTTSISTCMSKYFTFSGRASRSEFWFFYLFTVLMSWAAGIVSKVEGIYPFVFFIDLFFLLPVIAAGTRRLHDTNRSGWWQLLVFTFIGIIPLMYWICLPGDQEGNKYGDSVV